MTYSETIDNINNRIENIISNRLPQTYQHITIEPSESKTKPTHQYQDSPYHYRSTVKASQD